MAGGVPATNVARWNGTNWSAMGSGMGGLSQNYLEDLAVSGSDVYAGGQFIHAGGIVASYIAKWDGSIWSALGSGVNNTVYPLLVSGKDLYAGGYFTTAGGKPCAYIARAYLLSVPTLSLIRSGSDLTISWPSTNTDDFALETAVTLSTSATWSSSTAPITDDGTNKSVNIPATNSADFFRLRRP